MYFYSLSKKGIRDVVQHSNDELNKLRGIPVKTLEEQKKFYQPKIPTVKLEFQTKLGNAKTILLFI